MGVWIETSSAFRTSAERTVTPCMGVWIETSWSQTQLTAIRVTPCMGVWIETPEVNLSHSLKTYRVSSLRSNLNSLF